MRVVVRGGNLEKALKLWKQAAAEERGGYTRSLIIQCDRRKWKARRARRRRTRA